YISKSLRIGCQLYLYNIILTSKIRPFEKGKDDYQLPPFFNALNAMGDTKRDEAETFSKFNRDYLTFLNFIDNGWPFIRRLHEIWLSDNHQFLAEQMRDQLPTDIFPLNNDLEYLRGIHQLFLMGFRSVLPKNFYDYTTKSIWSNIMDVAKANPTGYNALTEFFHKNDLLKEYEERVLKVLNSFIDKFPFFITAIGLESYVTAPDLSKNGTTTVSFEDVKHFYLECFEAIGEIIAIVLAYNNLKYRNDPFSMPDSTFKTVKTLQDFINMRNKGNKITFCSSDEVFNNIIALDTDNGLRNAIGHDSYSYDGVSQTIIYYSSGTKGTGESDKIYLIEFIQKALGQFYTIIVLIELLYQTRKFYYVQHGLIPISPDVFERQEKRKVGRNEPCPCGSGKKYKKCCGFNN
ncbi:SEC-C metal-binding domain-containing protein, partial [Oscillibacter sp.]|uniref:YecA family protein n=1 Tax=Oscillibacter sp. TaxID=1945593 RepID=UPI00289EE885